MKNILVPIFVALFFFSGCNIVPKSVQYEKEEQDLIGSTDSVNPRIEEIQVTLKAEGYETGNIEGRICKETREAIKGFQEMIGAAPTGYIDEVTLGEIDDLRRAKEALESKKDYKVEVRTGGSGKPTVKEIQAALKNAGFDPGAIDGKYGPKTRQAVREFQRAKGLVSDGEVGAKTWAELGKYL